MAKKKKDDGEEEAEEEVARITPLDVDFGREDMNALVAKVNEIIEHIK